MKKTLKEVVGETHPTELDGPVVGFDASFDMSLVGDSSFKWARSGTIEEAENFTLYDWGNH